MADCLYESFSIYRVCHCLLKEVPWTVGLEVMMPCLEKRPYTSAGVESVHKIITLVVLWGIQ